MPKRATQGEWLRRLSDAFRAARLPEAELEARDLLLHILCIARDAMEPEKLVSEKHGAALATALAQRLSGMPLDRILGERDFMGRTFRINADTLAPRDDSEAAVQLALRLAGRKEALRILDLGTGSGILLITLLKLLPDASGVGIDLSANALTMASANAERHDVGARAVFRQGSWFEGVDDAFDLIISNPPYIETAVIPTLECEVKKYDPHLALDGGVDGLDAYRAMASGGSSVLKSGGVVVLEIGKGQGDAVKALFEGQGFRFAGMQKDLSGIERALAFQPIADSASDLR